MRYPEQIVRMRQGIFDDHLSIPQTHQIPNCIFSAKLITRSLLLNILLTAHLQGGDLLLFHKGGSLGSSVQGHDGLSCNKKIKSLCFKMKLFFVAQSLFQQTDEEAGNPGFYKEF